MASQITIRPWTTRDRDAVQGLLTLLAPEALVVAGDARKAYVDHLVVAREWRRRGVARALMRHATDVATTAGASRLDLTASDKKVAARTLYASLGFQERETGSFRLPLTP